MGPEPTPLVSLGGGRGPSRTARPAGDRQGWEGQEGSPPSTRPRSSPAPDARPADPGGMALPSFGAARLRILLLQATRARTGQACPGGRLGHRHGHRHGHLCLRGCGIPSVPVPEDGTRPLTQLCVAKTVQKRALLGRGLGRHTRLSRTAQRQAASEPHAPRLLPRPSSSEAESLEHAKSTYRATQAARWERPR